jgi:hypothetical protein
MEISRKQAPSRIQAEVDGRAMKKQKRTDQGTI